MLSDYHTLIKAISTEIAEYNENPTKGSSAKIRKLSLQIGKMGASFRAYMINLDKGK